jgi:hypothetical protein
VAAAHVLVVRRHQFAAVRPAVVEAALRHAHGLHAQVARNRKVAVEALAHRHAFDVRGCNVGEAPGRHVAPVGVAGRKELPVLHDRITEGRVGDAVGGQREAADLQQHLAGLQRTAVLRDHQADGAEGVLARFEAG